MTDENMVEKTNRELKFSQLTELSKTILSEDADHIDLFEAMEPFLTVAQTQYLAGMLEVCPVHHCAEEICRDDREDCRAGRGA